MLESSAVIHHSRGRVQLDHSKSPDNSKRLFSAGGTVWSICQLLVNIYNEVDVYYSSWQIDHTAALEPNELLLLWVWMFTCSWSAGWFTEMLAGGQPASVPSDTASSFIPLFMPPTASPTAAAAIWVCGIFGLQRQVRSHRQEITAWFHVPNCPSFGVKVPSLKPNTSVPLS